MTTNQDALTKDQVRLYHEQGWAGPYTLISEEEMAGCGGLLMRRFWSRAGRRGWRRGTIFITGIWITAACMSC